MWRFMGVFLRLRENFGGVIMGNIAAKLQETRDQY